jgi:acyl carrier protein
MSMRNEVMEKIKELLIEVTGDPSWGEQLTGATDIINEVGLDSIQMINFVLMMEDEFGIEIDFENFDYTNFNSLDALCLFISETKECAAAM